MTDETREQIKRDTMIYVLKNQDHFLDHEEAVNIHRDGATHQHPIAYSQGLAEGRRQGYKEALIDFEKEMSEAMENNPDLNVEAWMWSILQKNVQNGGR